MALAARPLALYERRQGLQRILRRPGQAWQAFGPGERSSSLHKKRKLGYLGWDEGGDPYHKLERSLRALKDMRGRAVRHPRWASHIDA